LAGGLTIDSRSLFPERDAEPQVILTPAKHDGASVVLYPHFASTTEAEKWMTALTTELDWAQRSITIFGKRHLQPRLVAWHGDAGVRYRYSGQTLSAEGWSDALRIIRERCETETGHRFNSVLCNLYRDGNDAMGWHADNEPELGSHPVIASVSLGCARRFDLRHKKSGETHRIPLPAGSLLVMAGSTQQHWVHQVPRTKKVGEARINLTFRHIEAPVSPVPT
jgi:alkylated DNA repair dioxygenase AlkB